MAAYGRRLGTLMGIKDIPGDFDGLAAFADAYERKHFARTDASVRLAAASLGISADMLPAPLRKPLGPTMRRFSIALLDEAILDATGLPRPTRRDQRAAVRAVRLRGRLLRLARPRPDDRPHHLALASYRDGHTLSAVGPEWMRGTTR
jgi:uncharacterized protein (DUF2236 family)